MTRVELGGTLYLVALIAVLLIARCNDLEPLGVM
jgi:hypothetical protein